MNRSWTVAGVKRQGRLLAGLAVALPLGAAGLAVQAPGTSRAVAGIISTVVGGVGGPGKATTIPLAEPYSRAGVPPDGGLLPPPALAATIPASSTWPSSTAGRNPRPGETGPALQHLPRTTGSASAARHLHRPRSPIITAGMRA
jgi:hypothetical protein